jgi:acyl-CoA synthetase (AMP-forming)/AMP-acid ligase II/acyl carrier protein
VNGDRWRLAEEQRPDASAPASVPELLTAQAAAHGERVALAAPGGPVLSYGEVLGTVDRVAVMLAGHGVSRASRLAVVLPNGLDAALGLLAASSVAIAVPMAPHATADEYRTWFLSARVDRVLTIGSAAQAARDVAAELGLPVHRLSDPPTSPCALAAPRPEDLAVVLMTSGSTGVPKRVPLTHANLLAGARSVAGSLGLEPDDRLLVMWEQHHVGGLVDLLLAPLVSGGSAVCAGGFDAARFFALVGQVQPTWFQGVPTTLRELLVHARHGGLPMQVDSLRFLRSVAAPLPPALMGDLESAFGVPVVQTFGMTEAAPLITTNRLPPGQRKPGSTGTPCGCEVAVLDAQGDPLPPDAIGEVAVRGPNVFGGYEDDPEANANAFRRGWFLTGDLGRFDGDGFLFLTGRSKEMINRGGEKIAPVEVEEAAVRHPAVAQAAAFAIPHPTLGEDVGLAVVSAGGATVESAAIRQHIATTLSSFKVPATVLVLDALPRCPIGKVRRRDLTALAVERMRGDGAAAAGHPAVTRNDSDPIVVGLAALWAVHLDQPSVDPDTDFRVLGGDSLAYVRLLQAVESLCGVSLPGEAAAPALTVRSMAESIRTLRGQASTVATCEVGRQIGAQPGHRLYEIVDQPVAAIRSRLKRSRTVLELKGVQEALLDVLTLDELANIVSARLANPLLALVRFVPIRMPVAERLAVQADLVAWQTMILARAAAPSRPRWERLRRAPGVTHYRRTQAPLAGRRLIVGFSGNQQRLMLPLHLVLDHLPQTDDLLLLSDPDRRYYVGGIRDLAPSLPAVCEWLLTQFPGWGYDTVVTFGTSAGGLAAVCAALQLRCSRAVAVGADSPDAHPVLDALLRELMASTAGKDRPAIVLHFDPANARDRVGGETIHALVTGSMMTTFDAGGVHNTLHAAYVAGRLGGLLTQLLGGHR